MTLSDALVAFAGEGRTRAAFADIAFPIPFPLPIHHRCALEPLTQELRVR